ncbi:MAG TPA: hypothetical protein VK923_07840 [Euzebyales bacterium]|nr:hypothetical protein [Euzebyales bacterium]
MSVAIERWVQRTADPGHPDRPARRYAQHAAQDTTWSLPVAATTVAAVGLAVIAAWRFGREEL